jgi:hypothetical protein
MFKFLNNIRVPVFKMLSMFSQLPQMISLVLDKTRDFQTLFEFYTIFKLFYLTMFNVMRESNVENLASFHVIGLKDAS